MPLRDVDRVDVDAVLEPTLRVRDSDVVAAHLPLPHQSVLCKRPVLEPVRAPPLACVVVPLVPELDGDLWAVSFDNQWSSCAERDARGSVRFGVRGRESGGSEMAGRSCLVIGKGKELLPQTIALLLLPLLCQELHDLIAPTDKLVTVPPDRIRRVRELDSLGVPTGQSRELTKPRLLLAPSSHVTAHRSKWGARTGVRR